MNKIQQWDLRVCRVCLLHPYNRPQARISRVISRTGDGPLYAVLAALLWWQGEAQREVVQVALLAFAAELPLYLLLKNALGRQRRVGLPVFITPRSVSIAPGESITQCGVGSGPWSASV